MIYMTIYRVPRSFALIHFSCKIAYSRMLSDHSTWTCYVEIVHVNRVFTVYLQMCNNCIYIIKDEIQLIGTNMTALFLS